MEINLSPHPLLQKFPAHNYGVVSWRRLQCHDAVRLGSHAMCITCVAGRTWLTQEQNFEDIFLSDGESVEFCGAGLVVAQGLPSALLKITRL